MAGNGAEQRVAAGFAGRVSRRAEGQEGKVGDEMSKLEKITAQALVDCCGEEEQFSGWPCTFEDKIRAPRECAANGSPAIFVKIAGAERGNCVHALVKLGKNASSCQSKQLN